MNVVNDTLADKGAQCGQPMELDDFPSRWIAWWSWLHRIIWPIGLALLIYLKWSGRMFCSRHGRYAIGLDPTAAARAGKRDIPRLAHAHRGAVEGRRSVAFDEYREETCTARRGASYATSSTARRKDRRVRPFMNRRNPAARAAAGRIARQLRLAHHIPSRRKPGGVFASVVQLHRQFVLDRPPGEVEQDRKGIARAEFERRLRGQGLAAPSRHDIGVGFPGRRVQILELTAQRGGRADNHPPAVDVLAFDMCHMQFLEVAFRGLDETSDKRKSFRQVADGFDLRRPLS